MAKVGTWSTNAGNNNSTPPDGWPEGQAPSTVNDCAREMMAQIRTYLTDAQYFDAGNTPSFLTSTTFSLGTSDTTTFHVGRRVKLFDTTTLYGTIDSVSATFVSVRLDSGALSSSLSSVAVGVVTQTNSSLPDNAFNQRNTVINGNMEVWQRGNGPFRFSAGASSGYTADRFLYAQSASSTINVTRGERSFSTNMAPTLAQAGQLLNSCLVVSVSAADAAIGAAEFATLAYRMEGYDWRQIAHRPNILTFWAYSTLTGTYCVSLRPGGNSASFVQNYTIGAASTWSRFAITVPEAPTNVTWDYSSSVGVVVNFTLAAGSSLQGGAGNWTAVNAVATSSQTNFLGSSGNTFKITGVDMRAGTQIPPLSVRPYAEELALCQRYYWRGLPPNSLNFGAYTAGALCTWAIMFPATMRDIPAVAMSAPGIVSTNLIGNPSPQSATPNGFKLIASASAASTNTFFTFNVNTDFIEADAEL